MEALQRLVLQGFFVYGSRCNAGCTCLVWLTQKSNAISLSASR